MQLFIFFSLSLLEFVLIQYFLQKFLVEFCFSLPIILFWICLLHHNGVSRVLWDLDELPNNINEH